MRRTAIHLGLFLSIALGIGAVASWAPVLHDGWGHFARHLSIGDDVVRALRYYSPSKGNPRLGEVFLLLSYFDFPVHVIFSVLFIPMLFLLMVTLVRGRRPRLSSELDLALFFSATALLFWLTHHAGEMFFYRPFLANYVYGAVFSLAAFLPLRLGAYRTNRPAAVFLAFLLGALGGFSNEHTGPGGIAVFAIYFWHARRSGETLFATQRSALIAYSLAYGALFFAPGQAVRYEGLAEKTSLIENLLSRGLLANSAMVFRAFWPYGLVFAALVLVCRATSCPRWTRQVRPAVLTLLAAQLIAFTSLASPILEDRLLFASTAVGHLAVLFVLAHWLQGNVARQRLVLAIGYVGTAIFFAVSLPIYRTVFDEYEQRVALLLANADAPVVSVPLYSYSERTHFFFGDDVKVAARRAVLAKEMLRGGQIEARARAP